MVLGSNLNYFIKRLFILIKNFDYLTVELVIRVVNS